MSLSSLFASLFASWGTRGEAAADANSAQQPLVEHSNDIVGPVPQAQASDLEHRAPDISPIESGAKQPSCCARNRCWLLPCIAGAVFSVAIFIAWLCNASPPILSGLGLGGLSSVAVPAICQLCMPTSAKTGTMPPTGPTGGSRAVIGQDQSMNSTTGDNLSTYVRNNNGLINALSGSTQNFTMPNDRN
jgi:hypothetical protein